RDDNDIEVPIGVRGELVAKGPQIISEYWNNLKETTAAFTPDGYFKTGDIVVMDDRGYLYVVDRKKDLVIVSGFKVYPVEVEDILSQHPDILDVAIVSMHDDKTGEA